MLILQRAKNEKIVIETSDGEKIIVQVRHIKGSSVRLVIYAPDRVTILRSELINEF